MTDTGGSQISETVSPEILFGDDYTYFSSVSPALQEHFRKSAELLAQRQAGSIETPVAVASLYAWSGDKDEALAWLERAYQRHVSHMVEINTDPAFESLYSDPRFEKLLQRVGLSRVAPPRVPVAN